MKHINYHFKTSKRGQKKKKTHDGISMKNQTKKTEQKKILLRIQASTLITAILPKVNASQPQSQAPPQADQAKNSSIQPMKPATASGYA